MVAIDGSDKRCTRGAVSTVKLAISDLKLCQADVDDRRDCMTALSDFALSDFVASLLARD